MNKLPFILLVSFFGCSGEDGAAGHEGLGREGNRENRGFQGHKVRWAPRVKPAHRVKRVNRALSGHGAKMARIYYGPARPTCTRLTSPPVWIYVSTIFKRMAAILMLKAIRRVGFVPDKAAACARWRNFGPGRIVCEPTCPMRSVASSGTGRPLRSPHHRFVIS